MSEESNIEKLKTTPVTELNLGSSVSLRRAIKRAGFRTLPELLSLSEKDIDDLFEWDDADEIIKLRDRYCDDPDTFAASVFKERKIDQTAVERILSKARATREDSQKAREKDDFCAYFSGDGPAFLPPTPFSDALREFEKRAQEVLDDLDDKFQNVMVYQAFEEFLTDLDELNEAFGQLFAFYKSQPGVAIGLIDKHLRNAFVVYVADRARNVYSKRNLWDNFFNGLGIFDSNVKGLFKQVFASHIERRGMPLYARDEEVNYYFYTALLHGGLSEDAWVSLWDKSILPLAKEIVSGDYGFHGEMDGHSILKEIKDPESRFAPNKTVLNILEKAPDSTIASLFEASMRVATQIEGSRKSAGGLTMLSSFGLPEVAMEALRKSQERVVRVIGRHSGSPSHDGRQGERRLIYLPMASLQLDLSEGFVSMRWPRQQFPLSFIGARIDYYVDGKMESSIPFENRAGKCILEASRIIVKPQARYDVELRLMQRDETTGEYEEKSSLHQTFARSKPGCFEFIKDAKGIYRLRRHNERITRKRRIAYIVKDGYRIIPGQGMSAISEYETAGGWDESRIFIYDVEPGSAGSVVHELTGEEVAIWQERYVARIDKRRVIGETVGGVDLYGHAPCALGTNGGLPSIAIEAIDGLAALDDLDITCVCDGRRVSVPRHILWADDCEEADAAQIVLVPQESSSFDCHIEECLIEARQKSAGGKAVFRYRFSVLPIQNFRLDSINFDLGVVTAKYGFQPVLPVDVANDWGDSESINAWGRYSAKTLLKDDFLRLRIQSKEEGKETLAKFALAAIDIKIPDRLARISKERPICLADALELGASAAGFRITAYGWRHDRAVLVMLGSEPLFLKELKQPGEHEFNLFKRIRSFQQIDESRPNIRPLNLSVIYGDDLSQGHLKPAWTNFEMLNCIEGLGILSWRLLVNSAGEHLLRFEGAPVCDICFDFRRKIGGKLIADAFVVAGSTELVLPSDVVRLLDIRKRVVVEMVPLGWFGEPQREYVTTFILKR